MSILLATASTAGLSILGVSLGEPLNVPECPFRKQYKYEKKRGDKPEYVSSPESMCFKIAKNPGTFHIKFPVSEKLPILSRKTRAISVQILDGKVEYIGLFTEGRFWQKRDFEILVKKFGKPESQEAVTFQNGFGARTNAIKAHWVFEGGYKAVFQGFDHSIDQGYFWIGKPEAKYDFERLTREFLKTDREF